MPTTRSSPTPASPTGGSFSASPEPPADPLEVLESALRDAFATLMTLVDEEDAVLLYRCSRLAEASPLLLESCDQRRSAIEEGLADKCERLWHACRGRLVDSIEQINGAKVSAAKMEASKLAKGDCEERLVAARTASAVREQQFLLEKESAIREALRIRAEEDAKSLAAAEKLLHDQMEENRLRTNRAIAEARGAAQADSAKAEARAVEAESKLQGLRDKLSGLDAQVSSLSHKLGETQREATEAEQKLERIEVRLLDEIERRERAETEAAASEAMRLQAEREFEQAREEALAGPEMRALEQQVALLTAENEAQAKEIAELQRRQEELARKQGEFRRRAESAERELMRVRESGDELQQQLARAELALKEPPPVLPVARTMSAKQVEKMSMLGSADAIREDAAAAEAARAKVTDDEIARKAAVRAERKAAPLPSVPEGGRSPSPPPALKRNKTMGGTMMKLAQKKEAGAEAAPKGGGAFSASTAWQVAISSPYESVSTLLIPPERFRILRDPSDPFVRLPASCRWAPLIAIDCH